MSLAGPTGIEPVPAESKSAALPLSYEPRWVAFLDGLVRLHRSIQDKPPSI